MGKFNIKRFWLTFKWFFYENRGLIVKWSLGIMLGVWGEPPPINGQCRWPTHCA